ncbi:hypothetical protein [Roseobacter cerasinus]|uniref:hypothetical protein n=1 Tax=Roseobacter cerasinus TaxID=2602289 RepID=UPI001EEA4CA2|nr:hypothetical protein [Roseobacter cerasinus]
MFERLLERPAWLSLILQFFFECSLVQLQFVEALFKAGRETLVRRSNDLVENLF